MIRCGRRPAGAAFALAAILAGCLDAPAPTVAPTPTRTPEPTPTVTEYRLGTTVWYEGLVLQFDRAVATLDERGGPVEVRLRVENPGEETSDLNAPITLLVAGDAIEPNRESHVPSVPSNGLVGAVLTYELQEIDDVDDAVIEIGAAPNHVAKVPLTPLAGEAVVFEPQALEVSGAATAGDVRLTLKGAELRWDLPDWSQELPSSLQALTLTYDVAYLGDFAGGFAFTSENVTLRLPDGHFADPRRDGRSQSIELIGAHKTKAGMFSRFEIPSNVPGEYALFLRNGSTERAVRFTIGG